MSDDDPLGRKPGQFADERFSMRRGAWLRRVWWAVPICAIPGAASFVCVFAIVQPERFELILGLGIGMALSMMVFFLDSPPHHIERWRQGREGERRTGRALKAVERAGWSVFHDIDTGRGNIDHIAIGSAGVFLLETKNLTGGAGEVAGGVLRIRGREDPQDGYVLDRVAGRARRQAAALAANIRPLTARPAWVQPVVVLWCPFEQRAWRSGGVAWVAGAALAESLLRQPQRLSEEEVAEITAGMRRQGWVAGLRAGEPAQLHA